MSILKTLIQESNIPDHHYESEIMEVAEQYAAAELKRYAQYMKDQGFCPDQAYCGHIDDCMASFTKE